MTLYFKIDDFLLFQEVRQNTRRKTIVVREYRNYGKLEDLLIPFLEVEHLEDGRKVTVTLKNCLINPDFSEKIFLPPSR